MTINCIHRVKKCIIYVVKNLECVLFHCAFNVYPLPIHSNESIANGADLRVISRTLIKYIHTYIKTEENETLNSSTYKRTCAGNYFKSLFGKN